MSRVNPEKLAAIVAAIPVELRNHFADVCEHASELAARGHVPAGDGGNIGAFFAKQPEPIRNALLAIKNAADLPQDRPFAPGGKLTPSQRFESFGLGPQWERINDAIDGLYVVDALGADDRSTRADPPRDFSKSPMTRREVIGASLEQVAPRYERQLEADREVAKAGIETNLPLRAHIESGADVIGASRGYDLDEPIEARGGNNLRGDIERSIVDVAERQP